MQLGDHLGFAGIVVGLIGVGITLLWPTARWVGLVCLVAALVMGGFWYHLAHHPEGPSAPITPDRPNSVSLPPVSLPPPAEPKPKPVPVKDDKPPTLLDLFQKDMPQIMKGHRDGAVASIPWNDGTITHIKAQVYLDFDANTKFVGFYIPAANPMVSTQTAQACLLLNQDDAVQKVLDDLPGQVTSGRPDQMTNAKDLTFSGRVLIYHEAYLAIREKGDIIRAYALKHQDVQFRGPDYLGDAVVGWYRDHGIPKPKQQ